MIEFKRFIARRRQWQWFPALIDEHLPNVIQAARGFADGDSHTDRPDRTIATVGIAPGTVAANPQRQWPAAECGGNFGWCEFIRPRLANDDEIGSRRRVVIGQVIHLPHFAPRPEPIDPLANRRHFCALPIADHEELGHLKCRAEARG